ncbi:MAG: hypothetical protein JEZ04_08630 [Spirochaetales bacterium]|nr:hypothetical protein [Spirochaetales bacterium]
MNIEKLTGLTNIAYSTILLITGILFYILFPVKEIGSNYSILVNSAGWIPINIIAMVATVFGIGSLKAKVFPKWACILLIIGAPAYAILLSIPPFRLLALALYCAILFGYSLSLISKKTGVVK